MKRKSWSRLFAVLCISFLIPAIAFAQTVTIRGNGTGRDDAIRDGLRAAVEQAVGTMVDSTTLSRNNQIVTDEIYTKSSGFVEDYQVTNEQNVSGVYNVTMTVTVNTDPNSILYTKLQKLKLIEVMLRDPRIAVLIPESHQSSALADAASETAVIQKLREAGFKHVLDARQTESLERDRILHALDEGNLAEARDIAAAHQLDFMIVGEATCQYVGSLYGSSVQSSRAHIDAKILKIDTGEIIAAQGFDAGGVDITPLVSAKKALGAAGTQVGTYMVQQLMQYASDPDKPMTIIITQANFNKLNLIQNALKQIPGVKTVFLRSYNNGLAQIDVTYTGSSQILADSLKNTDGVSLDITNISNSTVQATLR